MCGFLTYFGSEINEDTLSEASSKIKYRGPDNTKNVLINEKLFMSFHRLSIIDVSDSGNQPLKHPQDENLVLVCNGEIYNYKELAKEFNLSTKSGSDCEVILHLYKDFGIEKTVKMLDGVFAFCLYDANKDILYAARDPHGVRPAFMGIRDSEVGISSEAKVLIDNFKTIIPFPPGSWWSSEDPAVFASYFSFDTKKIQESMSEEEACSKIRELLTDSVRKRMMSEREVGCLLSGGLDSSLIASLVASMSEDPSKLKTFSIGMEGSPDLDFADKVAKHIGSDHHRIQLTQKDFLDAIKTVIYNIESYDTTTVRASIGNYLVSKYISENTDVKVVFNGDGADEVRMGYVYNINAPSADAFLSENQKLLRDIYLFDVLRSDRSISSNGLEARTPFLDKQFTQYVMSIPPEMKMFGDGKPEKYLLRKAFENSDLLPEDVLWRNKCAFSDGVSSLKNSWHKTLQEFINSQISDEEFELEKDSFDVCKPALKESYFYRKLYISMFGKNMNLIPYFWMPNWTDVKDPSARELKNYQE